MMCMAPLVPVADANQPRIEGLGSGLLCQVSAVPYEAREDPSESVNFRFAPPTITMRETNDSKRFVQSVHPNGEE